MQDGRHSVTVVVIGASCWGLSGRSRGAAQFRSAGLRVIISDAATQPNSTSALRSLR
ncbi:hypothetical protein BDW71DRAFT_172320 [Aspergillus fruticulosus]